MKQSYLGLNLATERTREREFLAQMERVVAWGALVEPVAPYAPEGKKGRPPFAVETMLGIHFMHLLGHQPTCPTKPSTPPSTPY